MPWPAVDAVHGPAERVELDGGRAVIDPPYAGTTGYGCDLGRAAVLALAQRLDAAGVHVGVCEGEPLPLAGWHTTPVESAGWQRRLSDVDEWLTMNRPLPTAAHGCLMPARIEAQTPQAATAQQGFGW